MTSLTGTPLRSVCPVGLLATMVSSDLLPAEEGGGEAREVNGADDDTHGTGSAADVNRCSVVTGCGLKSGSEGGPRLTCLSPRLDMESGRRRNKRKNFQPRNIVYHYPDSEGEPDYTEGDSSSPVDLRPSSPQPPEHDSSVAPSIQCQQLTPVVRRSPPFGGAGGRGSPWKVPRACDPVNLSKKQEGEVMDLSAGSREVCGTLDSPASSPPAFGSADGGSGMPKGAGSLLRSSEPLEMFAAPSRDGPADASVMKDYAESTMKELLGMYGLNDVGEAITSRVPLHNFSSGKILETMAPVHLSYLASLGHLHSSGTNFQLEKHEEKMHAVDLRQTESSHSKLSQSIPVKLPNNAEPQYESPVNGPSNAPPQQINPSPEECLTDSFQTKMTAIPSTGLIGSSPMILPPNMATFLTLAAFAPKISSNSHPSEGMTAPSPGLVDSSVTNIPTSIVPSNQNSTSTPVVSLPHLLKVDQQKSGPIDYARYVKRFASATECGSNYCKDLNYREHFHCLDCNSRVFVKKEEMIRHFKWHKKRDESLQHGFMRYSPMDDCSDRFQNCSHNRKQTHYHCLKEGCDKVYISTSDVQMHANYHRKDSAIIQEGFQRFRATEDCATPSCLFFGQRTTHFHCRRTGCSFTFKNKADMEKHKTYHIKDEQLNKDGFKKFMKHEHCSFENCRFSRVCNHIHCIRPGCTYVLHSSGQLYSHKRKHERRDTELAYRKFKLAQSMMKSLSETTGYPQAIISDQPSSGDSSSSPAPGIPSFPSSAHQCQESFCQNREISSFKECPAISRDEGFQPTGNLSDVLLPHTFPKFTPLMTPLPSLHENLSPAMIEEEDSTTAVDLSNPDNGKDLAEDLWKKYLKRYSSNESCQTPCEFQFNEHYHCIADNCSMTFMAKDFMGVVEHARNHESQEQVTSTFYTTVDENAECSPECSLLTKETHYHCKWEGCHEVISSSDNPFRRLDHYKIHNYSKKLTFPREQSPVTVSSAFDVMFRRKRGRPPKNRVIEFPIPSSPSHLPQAIYSCFKLPKPGEMHSQMFQSPFVPFTSAYGALPLLAPPTAVVASISPSMPHLIPMAGLAPYQPISAPDTGNSLDQEEPPSMTSSQESQPQIKLEIQEGFYVFSEDSSCPDKGCAFSGHHHYHCTQPRCFYVTDRSDILLLHSKDFHDNIDIMEGFVFYDRNVDCQLPGCHSNKVNRHFHCTRPNCNYSFVRYSTMNIHEQKHRSQSSAFNPLSPNKKQRTTSSDEEWIDSPTANTTANQAVLTDIPPKTTIVKAAGTFYPLSAFSSTGQPLCYPSNNLISSSSHQGDSSKMKDVINPHSSSSCFAQDSEQPLTKLLQKPGPSPKNSLQGTEKHLLFTPIQSCGRPFCKLKKRDHFHCNICNQALSTLSQLSGHVSKHSGAPSPVPLYPPGYSGPFSPTSGMQEEEEDEEHEEENDIKEEKISSGDESQELKDRIIQKNELAESLEESHVSSSHPLSWQPVTSSTPLMQSHLKCNKSISSCQVGDIAHLNTDQYYCSPPVDLSTLTDIGDSTKLLHRKRPLPCSQDDNVESKKVKFPSLRILKDEPVPEGYVRYRFNEDCSYTHCGYREHQTHFHCMRKDCGYSFCDKTRFVQHTARHERLDTLMGGDFQQYRANVYCGRPDCNYATTLGALANKSSHFHCFKCDFVCTDTNKVVAHRRQHAKMDSINAAGFEKFTPSQNCRIEGCNHNQKQTHYHCLKCQYAVLGLSQMSAHKYRHME